jgi:hypothetical protein
MLFARLRKTQLPWWIEIRTKLPACIYYFGPFESKKEARLSQHGYIEDLVEEKAQGITVELKKCQPHMLTIYQEFGE